MKKLTKFLCQNKLNLVLWAIFFCLITGLFFTGTFAKYQTQFWGSGIGTVAKFAVSAKFTGADDVPNFNFEENGTTSAEYPFSVKNDSEVEISYDVVLTFKQAIPNSVRLSIADAEITKSEDGLIYVFSNVGRLAPSSEQGHTLIISVDGFNTRINQSGITVQVIAQQVE